MDWESLKKRTSYDYASVRNWNVLSFKYLVYYTFYKL